MLHFKGLRLSGFKSFVDRTDIEIGPGLTGVIGPNGCGKSNILDGLRWTMGENSAKRMRGSGMEDVIFSGSENRSRRMSAEVSITLDNSSRTAPAAYNEQDTVEVSRKIERDSGSIYKINSKTVRARDVQLLFSDTLSGAHSPALVSQGRITTMISAKPVDRRQILEESAGISGLYARRHEAELRLRSADENLARLIDVIEGLKSRYNALQRQARDARRYRELGQNIRKLEKEYFFLQWLSEQSKLSEAKKAHEGSERSVQSAVKVVTQLTHTEKTFSDELPKLREKEAEASATYQAYNVSIQRLDDEIQRLDQQLAETKDQISQLEDDRAHTQQVAEDSAHNLVKIEQEQEKLFNEEENAGDVLTVLEQSREEAKQHLEVLEREYQTKLQSSADRKAEYETLKQSTNEYLRKYDASETRLKELKEKLDQKKQENDAQSHEEELKSALARAEKNYLSHKEKLGVIDRKIEELSDRIETERTALRTTQSGLDEIGHEVRALENLTQVQTTVCENPAIDSLSVSPGFETAVSMALGDSVQASINNDDSTARWSESIHDLSALPPLPESALPLNKYVEAPGVLQTCLAMIGVVENEQTGESLKHNLHPGQALVDREGHYWRWDGYQCRANKIDQTSQHLQQKNRLAELRAQLPSLESQYETQKNALQNSEDGYQAAKNERREVSKECDGLSKEISQLQRDIQKTIEAQSDHRTQLAKLEEGLHLAKKDSREIAATLQVKKEKLESLDRNNTLTDQSEELDNLKENLESAREAHINTSRDYEAAEQEKTRREARLRAIADERLNIQNRKIRANQHLETLEGRKKTLVEKLDELKSKPAVLKQEKENLLNSLSDIEARRKDAAENLAKVEAQAAETRKTLKDAENSLSDARENRAHALASANTSQENVRKLEEDIDQKFQLKAGSLIDTDEQEDLKALPFETLTNRITQDRYDLEKLFEKRNALGAVNLKADEEITEIEKEMEDLNAEYDDLEKAIAELRNAIHKLNKEARERLLKAFDTVNYHFQQLFVRLFNGGQAYLSLIDSEDPLESGLEIYAQPPGKSLQSLSLLSGGEQTLTAIALIFAMFLSNPSPICILDEVDAPLDDSNVDRVCNLLEDVASKGNTRFLVITHHRMTMARMDRLYGVTMAEKGVSKLVSVDMNQQMDLLEEITAA